MRGEHLQIFKNEEFGSGSSPHARGALDFMKLHSCPPGIIPACAGSTFFIISLSWSVMDHPRMRGEHRSTHRRRGCPLGSSPHARGALSFRLTTVTGAGIIPACAGSTLNDEQFHDEMKDHPRMRGEHIQELPSIAKEVGSSPHARGAQCAAASQRAFQRIIPACAGSTQYP